MCLALIAAALWPALSGGFIFDDYPIFVENPVAHAIDWHGHGWLDLLAWSRANVQRPLAMLSYALNYASGAEAWGFKATNLVIHLLNAALVATLASRLLRAGWQARVGDDPRAHGQRTRTWAWVLALLWGLHPLQVSAVMYAVQRMELMGFTFVLLALLAYWRGRQHQLAGARGWPWLVLAGAVTACGYLAKETAILVPGYALLIELTLLHFQAMNPMTVRRWKTSYALGVVAAIGLAIAWLLPHYATDAAFAGRAYTAAGRELSQLRILPMYLGWSVLPLPSAMHFYYDNFAPSTGWLHPATTLAGGLFLLALVALAIAVRKRRPLMALGIGWFFVAHAITSAPIPLELVFEHRNYPALLGVLLALLDLAWLVTARAHARFPALLATVFGVGLLFFTVLRAATWGNPLQLELTLVAQNPGSPRASYDLARRYMDLSGGDPASPLFARSIAELQRGAALPGSSPLAEQALIITAADYGFAARPAWWESLIHKLATQPVGPQTYRALEGLTRQLVNKGSGIDAHRLARAYGVITRRKPEVTGLHVQYADIASVALHDQATAAAQLQEAVASMQGHPSYPARLAGYLVGNGRYAEALAVIATAPDLAGGTESARRLRSLKAEAEAGLQARQHSPGG